MVPAPDHLPDVLPTDRLNERGKPQPFLRDELRRIPNGRNVVNVVGVWLQSFGVIAVACWIGHPLAWVVAFLLMGRAFALYAILSHEAAHRLLFSRKRANDLVGRWGLAYPAFVPLDLYRRSHFAHHKDEFGPHEPDLNLYNRYPVSRASMQRKLRRDALGVSGWKNMKGLFRGLRNESSRAVATKILATQVVLAIGLGLATGRWWAYPLLWLAPYLTVWRVINRLRSIAEHGGMQRSKDRRETTHSVRQHLPARLTIVPYYTGWHLAHHVDSGIPMRNLPRLHDELVRSGYVQPGLEYRSYPALWRALASG
jgi:fatty acid desaturase